MMACAEAKDKKRKRIMPRYLGGGGSGGAPPKYHTVYNPSPGQSR
jgi:hypothetical protein